MKRRIHLSVMTISHLTHNTHSVGSGLLLVWYLLAALLWHRQCSPHLQGCPTSQTSDNNIQVLIVNKQHCKHQPNLGLLLSFLRPRGNLELISQTTEGQRENSLEDPVGPRRGVQGSCVLCLTMCSIRCWSLIRPSCTWGDATSRDLEGCREG